MRQLVVALGVLVLAGCSLGPEKPDPVQTKLNDNLFLPQLVDPVLLKQSSPEDAVGRFRKDATAMLAG